MTTHSLALSRSQPLGVDSVLQCDLDRLRLTAQRHGLPFDLSVRKGIPGSRARSLRYMWHQAFRYARTVGHAPFRPETYRCFAEPWGLECLIPGVLYRCAEPRPLHFARVKELGIRTLVCVKRTLPAAPTLRFAAANDLMLARVDLGADGAIERNAVDRVLSLLARPELWPIMLHCDGGRHRTGIVTAALRCAQGVSLDSALCEYRTRAAPTARVDDELVIRELFAAHGTV